MKNRAPQLFAGGGGMIDHEFFPAALVKDLERQLSAAPLTEPQKRELIQHCNDRSQFIPDGDAPASRIIEQLERLANDSRRLLATMNLLERETIDTMQGHEAALVFMGQPEVSLPVSVRRRLMDSPEGELLPVSHEWVKALEICSNYASSKVHATRQGKPEQAKARALVELAASKVQEMTGKLPAKTRDNWFAAFVSLWLEHLGLDAGPRIVKSGIERAQGTVNPEES